MTARLVDRIGLGDLTEVFPPELVDAVLAKSQTREVRVRLLPPRLMVYFVLARALFSGEPYREVLRTLAEARLAVADPRHLETARRGRPRGRLVDLHRPRRAGTQRPPAPGHPGPRDRVQPRPSRP
ncbi:transposase domain-containing protein [Streptomyces sp. NBC_00047]|uniref:transposase domain-containing protein n=1 Tax=Streptomyces sp. NBC_00047 TaxID=2975627 RepID=UPI0022510668|nr:transposase domain-containing protein [Streptomyces sp. NBC_00047]MCX5609461.1 transposase domain-containing protein [Streptomyces sp. NBC_00047]